MERKELAVMIALLCSPVSGRIFRVITMRREGHTDA